MEIWNDSNKKSVISGRDLSHLEVGSTLWRSCFAHVLPKCKYPEMRLLKENIMLIHFEEHHLIDQGTEEQRTKYTTEWKKNGFKVDFSIFYERQELLKENL